MKLGPVTKLDNRNITMIKEFSDDMSFQQIERPFFFFFFKIDDQYAAIQKPDSWRMVNKT